MTSISHSQLRAFHAVATEGSFTRAAQLLNVTQPTLSGQVRALEERFGVRLFDRRRRRIEVTDIGRNLLDITFRMFSLELEAVQVLSAAHALKRGHLRIGADAPYHSVPFLSAFHRRYPDLRLSMTMGNTKSLLDDLLDQRCDVAIAANVKALVNAINRAKPSGPKGTFIKKVSLSSTMGPGIKLDPASALG